MKKDNQLFTDLFIKLTEAHQYLHASSCHVSHFKKIKTFKPSLRFNRICSEKTFLINDVMNWRYGRKKEVTVASW